MNDSRNGDTVRGGPASTAHDVLESYRRYKLLVESVEDYAILMLDCDGVIQSWNVGVEKIYGYTAPEAIGRHFSLFYPPESIARRWPEHEIDVASRVGRFEDDGWRVRKDGTRFWANVVITTLHDDTGRVSGFAKITRDLTQRRRDEDLLRESEERFRLLVEGVKDYAIFMLTPEGRIASWNVGAQNIKGYSAAEVLGKHFSIFYPPDAMARHWPEHQLRIARDEGRSEDEGWRVRKDGTRFWANVVITALFDSEGELKGFAKITRDLTARRQVEELKNAERRTNEFLAMLAHELRNPLSPLQTALDILERKPEDAAALDWVKQVFQRQVRHLTRLVDDLLDASRVTSGKISLRFESVDLAEVVRDTVESMRPSIEERQHELHIEIPDRPAIVRGDATRLAQVVSNLLTNASKYTPDGGRIDVIVDANHEAVMLHVNDTGVGIAPELIPQMFELFVQGDRALDRKEGGLGIGLTLVKWLAELHGGTVAATSRGPGHGTRFSMRLPLVEGSQDSSDDVPRRGERQSQKLRVLVVDDNADSAYSMALLLQILGHEVDTVSDGTQALLRATQSPPDLVLLDIGLPRISGYEVARALRAIPALARTTLVACTGYGHEDDRRKAREAGFDQHLIKPVQASDLEQILHQVAARKRVAR